MNERLLIVEGSAVRGQAMSLLSSDLGNYVTTYARTILEAFTQLKQNSFDMVITNTDVERQGDGVKLLQVLLLRGLVAQPPMIVVVALRSDRELIQQCRRAGVVDYILYPYDVENLFRRVAKALSQQRDMSNNEIRRAVDATLKQILELPTIEPIHQKLTELLNDRETSAGDVARVIEIDQSLTAKVLRLANSALFGFARRIISITDAVSLIGFQQVADLVAVVSTFEALGRVTESPRFNREAFWQHSIGCGAIAKTISEQIGMDASRAFVAGIVHDIGKVILDAYFPDYFEKALQEAASEHLTIYEAERRVLPMTHEDVGRHLAQQWLLPEELVAAIGSHHGLEHRKQAHTRLSELIHVANTQCRLLKVGHSGDDALSLPNSHALQHLGLRPADLQAWQPQMHEAITAALSVMQG